MKTVCRAWNEWNIEREIGRGSYGTVYRCFKEENGEKVYSAIKVISIPQNEYEISEVASENMTDEQSKEYYKDIADDLVKEIEFLKALKGTKNIVEIYDAEIIEKEEGIGWYILIRMELLTDFKTYSSDKEFTQEEVIKLGLDLSSALSVCHKAKIVHRDIKPENIFVDDEGNFKLGDFGVAKQMEKTQGSMSVKGTYNYMSPEVFSGKRSDGRADMYSLALVMYKLLNNNRLPFLDPNKQIVRYSERQAAFERRIKGEALPEIPGVSKKLNAVILKACAFRNADRQKNIDEFSDQLKKLSEGRKILNKRVITFVSTAVAAAVLSTAVVTVAYNKSEGFRNLFDGKGSAVEEIVKGPTEIRPVSVTSMKNTKNIFLGKNSVGGKYLLGIKDVDGNTTQYAIDFNGENGEIEYTDICKELGLDNTENDVYLYDGKSYFYVRKAADTSEYCIYRCEEGTDEVELYRTENEISNIIYRDNEALEDESGNYYQKEKNLYFLEWDDEKEYKYLKFLSLDNHKDEEISSEVEDAFVYNNYIIYSKQGELWWRNTHSEAEDPISLNTLENDKIYFNNGVLYFLEEYNAGGIGGSDKNHFSISAFSFKKSEDDRKIERVADTTGIEFEFDFEMSEIYTFTDKYCVLINKAEEGAEERSSYYIWSFEEGTCNKIGLPFIEPPEDFETEFDYSSLGYVYDIFEDKKMSDKMLLVWCEGYAYSLYEINSDGTVEQMSDVCYVKDSEITLCKSNFITLDKNGVIENIHSYKYGKPDTEYTDSFETVYVKATDGLFVRIGPGKENMPLLTYGTTIERVAVGSNGWSKVLYKDGPDEDYKVAYMNSAFLEKLEPNDDDLKKLSDWISSNVYTDTEELTGLVPTNNSGSNGFTSTVDIKSNKRVEEINGKERTVKLMYNLKATSKYAGTDKTAAEYDIEAELIFKDKQKCWDVKSVSRTYKSDGMIYKEALENNDKYSASKGDKYFVFDLNADGKNEVVMSSGKSYTVYRLDGEKPKKAGEFSTGGNTLYTDGSKLYYLQEKKEIKVETSVVEKPATTEAQSENTTDENGVESYAEAAEVAAVAEVATVTEIVEVTKEITKTTAVYITLDGNKIKTDKKDVTDKKIEKKSVATFSVNDFSGLRF